MSNFAQFLEDISEFKERPVKLKQIKKVLKINEKSFPPCKNILNYYFQEFSKYKQQLGRRTNEEHRTKWHRKDKILFVWTVLKYFELTSKTDLNPTDEDWHYLSTVLGVTEQLLNLKWISMLKTNLKMAPWNLEEDEVLQKLITDPSENKNWTQITIDFNRANPTKIVRHAKQIRERWNNYLNPDLKKYKSPNLDLNAFVTSTRDRKEMVSYLKANSRQNRKLSQESIQFNDEQLQKNQYNEDIAIHKLLANLQGRDYEGPVPLTSKRIRKNIQKETIIPSPKPMVLENEVIQEIKEEHQQEQSQQQQQLQSQQQQQQQQQQQPLMMGLPVYSPMLPFSPLHYLIQSSPPNNIQSPYEMRKQNTFPSQLQLFDELLKSTNDLGNNTPQDCFLRMFNSPAFNHQGFPFATMPFPQAPQSQPTYNNQINPINPINPIKISAIRAKLSGFDSGLNKNC